MMKYDMKTFFILNPRVRKRSIQKVERIIRQKFLSCPIEIRRTQYPGQATAIAQQAVQQGFETIVVMGGDGTINETLNGMVDSVTVLGIIPSGTANDLASYCHIPQNLEQACDILLQRKVQQVDVVQVNERFYLTAGGLGFPSEVAALANTIKNRGRAGILLGRILSHQIYLLSLLLAIFKTDHYQLVRVNYYNHIITCNILSLMINNQPFLGKKFLMAPGAINDDGLLDICLIKNSKTRAQILFILSKVLNGSHIHSSSVLNWRTDFLTIETENPQMFLNDGEILEKSKKFEIRVLPRALSIIVP
jgi:diacylglycerol kinase (ATP)